MQFGNWMFDCLALDPSLLTLGCLYGTYVHIDGSITYRIGRLIQQEFLAASDANVFHYFCVEFPQKGWIVISLFFGNHLWPSNVCNPCGGNC